MRLRFRTLRVQLEKCLVWCWCWYLWNRWRKEFRSEECFVLWMMMMLTTMQCSRMVVCYYYCTLGNEFFLGVVIGRDNGNGGKGKFKSRREIRKKIFQTLTVFTRIVIPWYLKGLLNSMAWALSGVIVNGATIISAFSFTSSPISPVHSFLPGTSKIHIIISTKTWNTCKKLHSKEFQFKEYIFTCPVFRNAAPKLSIRWQGQTRREVHPALKFMKEIDAITPTTVHNHWGDAIRSIVMWTRLLIPLTLRSVLHPPYEHKGDLLYCQHAQVGGDHEPGWLHPRATRPDDIVIVYCQLHLVLQLNSKFGAKWNKQKYVRIGTSFILRRSYLSSLSFI